MEQADEGSETAKTSNLSTDRPSDANLAGMVHDKEEVDKTDQAGSGPENFDSRLWKTSKNAAEHTRILNALHINHPADKKRFDKHRNSRVSGNMSSSGVSSNAKSTATINQDKARVRDKKTIHTLRQEKMTLEADKAELERNIEKKIEEEKRQQLLDLVKYAQGEGFTSKQIKAFAAMQKLSLDGPEPRKNVNFDGGVKDTSKKSSR